MDEWTRDGRPIYGVFPTHSPIPFRWPYEDWDVPATCLDAEQGFWRIGPPRRAFGDESQGPAEPPRAH
jgi:hypothetical protein